MGPTRVGREGHSVGGRVLSPAPRQGGTLGLAQQSPDLVWYAQGSPAPVSQASNGGCLVDICGSLPLRLVPFLAR